jgi:hypothetical protein
MKEKIKSKRISILFLILGGIGGFLYWRLVGCNTGTCPIKSNWYVMTPYGMVLGWLLGDLVASFTGKKPSDS